MDKDEPQEANTVMVQFHYDGAPPDRSAVAARFDIPLEAIDPDFGVIVTDEIEKLCTVLVPKDIAAKIDPALGDEHGAEGAYSNPRIEPFGPPDEDGGENPAD